MLSFDVTRQPYTAAAINAINTQNPHRTVSLVTGDSTLSVPNFLRTTNNGVKCNILFVDGAHTFETAYADIVNFRALANESYHRVFIDDISSPGVKQAVDTAAAHGILRLHSTTMVNQTLCIRPGRVQSGTFLGTYYFYRENECKYSLESDHAQDQVLIGEYIL